MARLRRLRAQPDAPFAQRLKALRLAAGLSRTELAQRSGVAPGSLRAYEDGERSPHGYSVARLARVLGGDLLTGSPHRPADERLCDAS